MHIKLFTAVSTLVLSTAVFAGFNVVDEDVAGAHYGNAQHSVFRQAIEGSREDLSADDKEMIGRTARTRLDSRYYLRVRGAPLGRLNIKKLVQTFGGANTVLQDAKLKVDEMQTSIAAGFSMSNAFSFDLELIIMESATFTKTVTLKDAVAPLGTVGSLSGRVKPRMFLVNGDYNFEPMQVTLAGATMMPYGTFGVGLTEINASRMAFTPAIAGFVTAPTRKRLSFAVGFGWKARATNDLTLDLGYRLQYLGEGRLLQIGSSTNFVMGERIIAHGLFLGGAFHF